MKSRISRSGLLFVCSDFVNRFEYLHFKVIVTESALPIAAAASVRGRRNLAEFRRDFSAQKASTICFAADVT